MNDKLKDKIKLTVFKLGLKSSIDLFGNSLINQAFSDDPLSYLSQYNKLTKIDRDGFIHLKNNDGETIVMFNRKRMKGGNVYINGSKIWMFFSYIMDLDREKIYELLNDWLKNEYGIVELEPTPISV
jgi:hypothetical protein